LAGQLPSALPLGLVTLRLRLATLRLVTLTLRLVTLGLTTLILVAVVLVAVVAVVLVAVVFAVVLTVVLAVVLIVFAIVATLVVVNSGCINAIIEAAVLGDRNIGGLVISGCVHRAETVITGRKAVGQDGGKDTILILVVQALEELKQLRIRNILAVDIGEFLDSDVAVRLQDAVINLLGSTKVVLLSIDKITRVHVFDRHLEGKRLIGREFATVDGERDLRSRHRR